MKDYGITILRVVVGAIYVMHAYLALVVFTPQGTARFMAQVAGLPAPIVMAWIVIVVHGLGGLLLLLGLRVRWAAAANAVVMVVALVTVHLSEGFFLKGVILDAAAGRAAVAGFEYVLLLVAATIALVLLGPGAWAVRRFR